MDIKRITSAVLGLPMVIIVLLLGNKYVVDVALAIVAIISLHEYYNAFSKYKPIKWLGYLCAALISLIHVIPEEMLLKIIALSIPVIVVALFIQLIIKNLKISIIDIAISLFGIFYIVLFIMFIPLIAAMENGKILVWYIFIISWEQTYLPF